MIPLELPTGDIATLLARMPFRSQHGAMRLSLDGLRFVERSGAELLHVGPDQIVDVESHGNADLWVAYRCDPARTRAGALVAGYRQDAPTIAALIVNPGGIAPASAARSAQRAGPSRRAGAVPGA